MIAHNTQGIQLKPILILCLFNGVEKDFTAFEASQAKLPIIATGCDVVAKSSFQVTFWARHCKYNEIQYQ
jgi:hypothetical protein